jgi:sterol desaturase/sphingolipid hydroxylase (fatty acid hydroxylase superfamily)
MSAQTAALVRLLLAGGGLALFLVLELVAPYRPSTVSKAGRWITKLSLTALNGILLGLAFGAITLRLVSYAGQERQGLLYALGLSHWAGGVAAVLFMDFLLYLWHLLNHEVPLFWRFLRVHHTDLNMDASTAMRFHVGELAASSVIKLGLVFFLGLRLVELLAFEVLLVAAAQFQHSAVCVPARFERAFWVLFAPPSMHRIHHSMMIRERNTNYGTIFSLWDRLLGTLRTDVDQDRIRIGVGAYPDPKRLNLPSLLVMPFTHPVP